MSPSDTAYKKKLIGGLDALKRVTVPAILSVLALICVVYVFWSVTFATKIPAENSRVLSTTSQSPTPLTDFASLDLQSWQRLPVPVEHFERSDAIILGTSSTLYIDAVAGNWSKPIRLDSRRKFSWNTSSGKPVLMRIDKQTVLRYDPGKPLAVGAVRWLEFKATEPSTDPVQVYVYYPE